MAITITKLLGRASVEVYDVITTLNGDDTVTITHNRNRATNWAAVTLREDSAQLWVLDSQTRNAVVFKRAAAGGSANVQLQATLHWPQRHGN